MRQELQFPVRKIITVKAGIQTEKNKKFSTVSFRVLQFTHLDNNRELYLSCESLKLSLRFFSVFARHLQSVYTLSWYCKHDAGWTEPI